MSTEFREKYDTIFEQVKPLNYINDGIIMAILAPAFFILIPLLIAVFKTKWNNMKIDMKISIFMVLFDLFSAMDAMMNHFFNLVHVPWNIPNQLACTINSILTFFFFFNSISLVGLLSLERCLLIVYKKHYSDRFYYIVISALVSINITICIVTATLDGFGLAPIGSYCLFDTSKNVGLIGALLAGALVVLSLIVIFFGYTKICIFRREQSKRAQLELGLDPAKVQKEVNSTILKSLSIIIASAFTNIPYTLILLISTFSKAFQTLEMLVVATILINMNITLNSLILINMKPELYKEIKKIYGFKVV